MLTSKVSGTFLVILAWICLVGKCHADIGAQRHYRLQHQRQQIQHSVPYPAAGYRPGRQFILPQEMPEQQQDHDDSNTLNNAEDAQQARRPHSNYEAPNATPQSSRLLQGEFQPQRFFFSSPPMQRQKSERLTASAAKSARLAINSEAAQEDDEDEIASDIEVDKQTDNVPRTAVASPQSSTVYYPAGAVSFLQPLPAAAVASPAIPQPAAAVIAQPAAANYVQQLQYANFQVQPVAAAAVAPTYAHAPAAVVPAATSALVQPTAAKLAVQPVATATAAKLDAQPVTATTFATAPAPYFAPSGFYASPTTAAAYTAPFVQPQFYVPAGNAVMAQLQAW